MDFLPTLQQHIFDYLAGKDDLSAVREILAPLVIEVGSCDDPEAKRAVYAMQRSVSDFAEGFLSESQLKQNFAALLFPSPSQSSLVVSGGPVMTGSSMNVVVETAFVGVGRGLVLA